MFDVEPRAAANASRQLCHQPPYPWGPHQLLLKLWLQTGCTVASDKREKRRSYILQLHTRTSERLQNSKFQIQCAHELVAFARPSYQDWRKFKFEKDADAALGTSLHGCTCVSYRQFSSRARGTFTGFGVALLLYVSTPTSFCLVNPLGQIFRPPTKPPIGCWFLTTSIVPGPGPAEQGRLWWEASLILREESPYEPRLLADNSEQIAKSQGCRLPSSTLNSSLQYFMRTLDWRAKPVQ